MGSKNISTLISDIESLFDNGTIFSDESISQLGNQIGLEVLDRFKEYGIERQPTLSLSQIGKPLRQLWFQIKSGLRPEPLSASTKFKLLYGNVLESLVIALAIEAGHKVERLQDYVTVDGVGGHIDCLIDDYLVDVKSASTYSFQKFKSGSIRTDDTFGYIGQLAGYSTALGGKNGAFLAIDKTLGHLCLCHFSKEELEKYDVHDKIRRTRESLIHNAPPTEYCYAPVSEGKSGNERLAVGCSYCSHKFNCWKDANEGRGLIGYHYASGPIWFTTIAKEPRVNKVSTTEYNKVIDLSLIPSGR
jgi:hypothetical protein